MKEKNNKSALQYKQKIINNIEKALSTICDIGKIIYCWIKELGQYNEVTNNFNDSNSLENMVSENEKLKKIIGEKELEIYNLKNYPKNRRLE